MQTSKRIIVDSLLWKFLEKCSVQLTAFIISVLLARILEPSEFGLVAIIMIFINLANVIIDGGLNTALIQKKNTTNIDFSTILYVSILMSVLLYSVLYVISPFIAWFYDRKELISLFRVLGLTLIFYTINSIQRAYVSKNMLFRKLFISSFVAVLFSGIVGLTFAFMGYGVWALIAQTMSCQIATTLIMWYTHYCPVKVD